MLQDRVQKRVLDVATSVLNLATASTVIPPAVTIISYNSGCTHGRLTFSFSIRLLGIPIRDGNANDRLSLSDVELVVPELVVPDLYPNRGKMYGQLSALIVMRQGVPCAVNNRGGRFKYNVPVSPPPDSLASCFVLLS